MTKHTSVKCTHCGNDDIEQIQHSAEQTSTVFRNVVRGEDGTIYVEEDVREVVDSAENTGTSLYCLKCNEYFNDPGLQPE